MTTPPDQFDPADVDRLYKEIDRLRGELRATRKATARTLARATRLAQVVSVLGQLTELEDIFARAATEVAEMFEADIAVVVLCADGGTELVGRWGIPAGRGTGDIEDIPAEVVERTATQLLVAGPANEMIVPAWLAPYGPRHLVWGRLAARREVLGYILLARLADTPFEPGDVHELQAIVKRISLAVDNGRLYQRTREQLQRLQLLHQRTTALAGSLELDAVVDSIATMLVADVPLHGAALYLPREHSLERVGHAGSLTDLPARASRADLATIPGTTLLPLGVEGTLGIIVISGAPAPDTEARVFLRHLVDLSSLVIDKSLLFERVRTQAEYDSLTGLPNRPRLLTDLNLAIGRARRTGTEVAAIFVDLDSFKNINDSYGHETGDQILVAVAQRLSAAIRPADTVARLGGDEFVVLCEDVGSDQAARIASRIDEALHEPFHIDGAALYTGCSIGLANTAVSGYTAEGLLRDADADMYRAKYRQQPSIGSGRGRVVPPRHPVTEG